MKKEIRLYQRNGWYHCELTSGKRLSLHTTEEAVAEQLAASMEKQSLEQKIKKLDRVNRITISELAQVYRDTRIDIAPGTLAMDDLAVKFLIDAVGDIPIRTLNTEKITQFKKVRRATAREVTVNSYLRHIRAMLNFAVAEGYLDKPIQVKQMRMDRESETIRFIPPDDINRILARAKEVSEDQWRYFMCLLWTGARRSEMLNLEWQRVKLSEGIMLLRKTKGKQDRLVPILDKLRPALEPAKKDVGRVFPSVIPTSASRWWRHIVKPLGIEHRLHDLRHSAAIYLLNSGTEMNVVSMIMGHRDLKTTKVYAKILQEMLVREMAKMKIE